MPTAVLLGLSVLCWAWLGPLARDMYGSMQGPSAWMMTGRWDGPFTAMMALMWVAMMAAMMLPSLVPTLLLFGSVVRRSEHDKAAARVYWFGAGYLATWAGYATVLTLLQRELALRTVMSPMMELRPGRIAGTVLLLAGLYQLTPLKRACLRVCQSPASFIAARWRKGSRGALTLGLSHGIYCVGCCWALMLLLFASGVMNLTALVGLTIFFAAEKLLPAVVADPRVSGLTLATLGILAIVRSSP